MGQGGRLPGPTARGARIEGIEGVRGVGQLAEGDWEDWGRARARATVAGETRSRQFAVGHGRAERSRGRSPWRGQAGVLTSWRWARMVPRDRRQPPTGRHDGTEGRPGEWREGRRQEGGLLSPSNISRVQVHPPVPACIYIYMYVCMYVCIDRSIDAPSPPSTAGPRRTGLDVYISPRVRCCTASRQVQISPDIRPWPAVLVTGTPSLRWGRPSRGQAPPPSLT